MQNVVRYLRQKLKRPTNAKKGGSGQETLEEGKCCWLCEQRPASAFHLTKELPLCLQCFGLAFDAVIHPLIREDQDAKDLAERVNTAFNYSSPVKLANETVETRRAVANVNGWCCPRCTFLNEEAATYCLVCLCASPKAIRCVHCKEVCERCNLSPARGAPSVTQFVAVSICPVAKQKHQVWECEACTFMNTVEGAACSMCASLKTWECSRCSYKGNTSKKTLTGERFCTHCGQCNYELTNSVIARLGLDPEETKKEQERQKQMQLHSDRLSARLKSLGLSREVQAGDGNCQFRALANQLLHSPEHHMLLRHVLVENMRQHAEDYLPLFESKDAFMAYCTGMEESGSWGDELTLRAAANTFQVNIHLITSDEVKWYLHFVPTVPTPSTATSDVSKTPANQKATIDVHHELHMKAVKNFPNIFILYLSPVHYDDIVRPPVLPEIGHTLLAVLEKLKGEENIWDEVSTEEHFDYCAMSLANMKQASTDWVDVTPAQTSSEVSPRTPHNPSHSSDSIGLVLSVKGDTIMIDPETDPPKHVHKAPKTESDGEKKNDGRGGQKIRIHML